MAYLVFQKGRKSVLNFFKPFFLFNRYCSNSVRPVMLHIEELLTSLHADSALNRAFYFQNIQLKFVLSCFPLSHCLDV